MTRFRTILITVAAAATLSLGAALPSFAAVLGKNAECLSDQQIQAAIQSGQIKSWPTVKKLARIPSQDQEVSDVRVCRINGELYYTVNLVSSNGEAKKIVVNAIDGSG